MGLFSSRKKGKERDTTTNSASADLQVTPAPPLGPPVPRAILDRLKTFWLAEAERRRDTALKAIEAYGKCSAEHLERELAAIEAMLMYCEHWHLRPTWNVVDSIADESFVPQHVKKQAKSDHQTLHADCCQLKPISAASSTGGFEFGDADQVETLRTFWLDEFERRQAEAVKSREAYGNCSAECLQQERGGMEAFAMYRELKDMRPTFEVDASLTDKTWIPPSAKEQAALEHQALHQHCCCLLNWTADESQSGSKEDDGADPVGGEKVPPPSYDAATKH